MISETASEGFTQYILETLDDLTDDQLDRLGNRICFLLEDRIRIINAQKLEETGCQEIDDIDITMLR